MKHDLIMTTYNYYNKPQHDYERTKIKKKERKEIAGYLFGRHYYSTKNADNDISAFLDKKIRK
jgi:hypothetical protein